MIFENIGMALRAVRTNKMRSFLTMLGIIIGIGSVIAIVSIGDSMRGMLAEQYESVGVYRAILYPSWSNIEVFRDSDYFTIDDLECYKEVFADDLAYVDSNAFVDALAMNGRNKVKFSFQGIDYNYMDVQPTDMIYGRTFNEGDILGRKNNMILEERGAIRLFGTADAVGRTFRTEINGFFSEFNVVGVYRQKLSAFEALMKMGADERESAFIPYTILTRPNDQIFFLNLYAKEGSDMNELSGRMLAYTANLKGREVNQYVFDSASQQMGAMDSMMQGMSMAVGAIAAISLLVGGIGIMNIMLVSVTERTREIGIRKSLGARTGDILIQFLTESAIIAVLGGIIGILAGAGIVSLGAALLGVKAIVKPSVILLAVSFSMGVGVFFGLYPASKAAKKDPIDALRFE